MTLIGASVLPLILTLNFSEGADSGPEASNTLTFAAPAAAAPEGLSSAAPTTAKKAARHSARRAPVAIRTNPV